CVLLIPVSVRCSAQTAKGWGLRESGIQDFRAPAPCVCAEEHRASRIRAARCLSAASLRGPRLDRAPQVAPLLRSGDADAGVAFSWATFFWRSKESSSPAGARPGSRPSQKIKPTHRRRAPSGLRSRQDHTRHQFIKSPPTPSHHPPPYSPPARGPTQIRVPSRCNHRPARGRSRSTVRTAR
ncbi:MAG: hypothetical protein RJA34_469, partial [Pseudomonadota bacterium]